MKYLINYILLLFVVASSGDQLCAQTSAPSSVQPGLLWEISGNGLKEASYLFGTYHFAGKSFLDTLPGVILQLKKANSVVGEVVIEDEMAMAQRLMPLMLLKDNSLDKILTAGEYAETDSFLNARSGMNLKMLNGMKPAAVQMMLVTFMAPKTITPQNPGVDIYFQTEARNNNKQVSGFETLEEQAALLFGSTIERQKELLLKTVRESARMIRESNELFEQYKHQDLQAIEKALNESEDYTLEEMNGLLAKRNTNWISKMPDLMNSGAVFFAVGAGHLVGKDGLITLLKTAGYTVKPLPTK